jgi:hypothetical protein
MIVLALDHGVLPEHAKPEVSRIPAHRRVPALRDLAGGVFGALQEHVFLRRLINSMLLKTGLLGRPSPG